MPLPAQSPDLSPIENVGHIFKQRLRKRFSKSKRPHSEDQLWLMMEDEWEAMDQAVIDALIDSLPSRIQAIVKAEGSHIKW